MGVVLSDFFSIGDAEAIELSAEATASEWMLVSHTNGQYVLIADNCSFRGYFSTKQSALDFAPDGANVVDRSHQKISRVTNIDCAALRAGQDDEGDQSGNGGTQTDPDEDDGVDPDQGNDDPESDDTGWWAGLEDSQKMWVVGGSVGALMLAMLLRKR